MGYMLTILKLLHMYPKIKQLSKWIVMRARLLTVEVGVYRQIRKVARIVYVVMDLIWRHLYELMFNSVETQMATQ